MSIELVAVVPVEDVGRLVTRGWRVGRSTATTATVFRSYPTAEEAMGAGRQLRRSYVWAVEGAPR